MTSSNSKLDALVTVQPVARCIQSYPYVAIRLSSVKHYTSVTGPSNTTRHQLMLLLSSCALARNRSILARQATSCPMSHLREFSLCV
ncbi:hypothetical protein ScPMuIL_017851 [Solemya velum]